MDHHTLQALNNAAYDAFRAAIKTYPTDEAGLDRLASLKRIAHETDRMVDANAGAAAEGV